MMIDILRFNQTGTSANGDVPGELQVTGIRPLFMPRLEAAGCLLGAHIFMPGGTKTSSRPG